MKFFSHTLGCRTNQYDTAAIEALLVKRGIEIVREPSSADVIYVQTCSVTGRADTKSGQAIRKFITDNPSKRVLVGGCGPQGNRDSFSSIEGVEAVFGVNSAEQIAAHITGTPESKEHHEFGSIVEFNGRKRANLKIQDGCDSFCTYCIIPSLRGKPVSRSREDVLSQLDLLVKGGFCEIVLTGIHVGKYQDDKIVLSDLIEMAVKIDGKFRLRLSSIEPQEIDEKLLSLVVNNRKVCNYLHIPLQSGDDSILTAMNRKYSASTVMELFKRVRKLDPFCGLGTDIITGFPGETEECFSNTVDFIANSPLVYGHVFPFSPRMGTPAAEFKGQIDRGVALKRVRTLRKLFDEKKGNFFKTLVGSVQNCIIESGNRGHTANFAQVEIAGTVPAGGMVEVKITGSVNGNLTGEIKGE
ncbi:MAG: tRNA (N(6)-L-threonylcarbamoyladenosine(37)-C(2))-methylthiotransferase MtaB [Fibrobacteres bacterium]|nr:tRNA (N(6)-L-threonylcarbamoyladenosine(37)-C(2))-methylthiotransferase MtaB [Fibrobacterota bacterium]